jgi:transcriptional regulator with XRE-family HTH domain
MSENVSVGSRIRERRVTNGLKQADLAAKVGISASYLNLIEHNRRRIAGKLLLQLGEALGIDPQLLSEGAQASIVARLRESAAYYGETVGDDGSAADFAARYPAWAQLVIDLDRKVRQLEQTVDGLSDRLSHDPHLATSLHEVLTTVTAIRSTSSILAETQDIEPEWQMRFHRNINEDSQRLAEEAQSLVSYLDMGSNDGASASSPWDELETFFLEHEYSFSHLVDREQGQSLVDNSSLLKMRASRMLAHRFFNQYFDDIAQVDDATFTAALDRVGQDAVLIAAQCGVTIPTIMRRLAFAPKDWLETPVGLAACDGSGSFFLRKPLAGFHVPRFGSACPLWPLFGALQSPMRPLHMTLTHTGREGGTFHTVAYADLAPPAHAGAFPMVQSYMLITPAQSTVAAPLKVGAACRVCAISGCKSRREMSILSEDL